MNFSFATGDATKAKADVLILPLFDTDLTSKKGQPSAWAKSDQKLRGLLAKLAQQEGFKGKAEQTCVVQTHGKLGVGRIMLLGLGARVKFTPEVLRLAIGRGIKAANRLRAKTAVVQLPGVRELDSSLQALVEGSVLGGYRYDKWRTTNADEKRAPRVEKVQLLLPDGVAKDKSMDATVGIAKAVGEAACLARDLVNEPAGTMTPTILAEQASAIAQGGGLEARISGRTEIEGLKMGMFLGVARGSVEEPRLIHLTYTPAAAEHASRPPVVFVGKAITFDSGGLSLKPSEGMLEMKTDMAGSAAVLGAMKVVARLKPPFPVHALMGACENMPSGHAYRLGDVLVSRLGKTVEITNTDAEGRLVLGDVLAYANELRPAAIIDLATLTGACIVALGPWVAGAFGEDDQLMWSVLEAARASGEEIWRLPLTDTLKDVLKSDVADMKNAGDRNGGSITAAHFLKEFVGDTPWVHLDIAGPSNVSKEKGYMARGGTGFGVRTLVEYVRRRTAELEAVVEAPAEG
ncbi:MAG: leucyl aminopeptidase [Myxococcaceae bacterium]|jgi:leucyl aminopeptidase|nr:leucyl aminopeptidase [Myxococcaceae bacterium]MCA3012572.1 leucyl aminopeptidase [Myxococcaceae bacterium]